MALKGQPFKKLGQALMSPEGAATGLGAAFVMGPAGLLVGAAQGILANRLRKSELDKRTDEAGALQGLSTDVAGILERSAPYAQTDIDRAQLDTLSTRRAQLDRLGAHPDPNVRQRAAEEMEQLTADVGAWQKDIETRNEKLVDDNRSSARQFVYAGLENTRKQATAARAEMVDIQGNADQLHKLLNDPGFNPDKPLDRGRALALLNANARAYLSDPEGLDDALKGAGGAGLISTVLGVVGGMIGAQDFDTNKDDWRRIATGMYDFANRKYATEAQRLGAQADLLGGAAQKSQVDLPFDPRAYALGEAESYASPYASSYPDAPAAAGSPAAAAASSASPAPSERPVSSNLPADAGPVQRGLMRLLDPLASSALGARAKRDENAKAGATADVPTVPDAQRPPELRDLFDRIDRLSPGTVARVNPDSGEVFAVSPGGDARPVEVSRAARRALIDEMRRRREARDQ